MVRLVLKGNENCFELAEGSSNRGFEFCVGVALNFRSFGRNCVTTFPWPGCFKSLRDSSSKYQKSFVCLRKICLAKWHRHWVLNTCEESSDNTL